MRLLVLPLIGLLLLLAIGWENRELFNDREAVMYMYIEGVKAGELGYGLEGCYSNGISFADLEPGDIVLGGYPDCAYGRFSHAGLYIGNGEVIESYIDQGVTVQSLDHYWNYSEICLLRVNVSQLKKQNAVQYLQSHLGDVFYPVAFKSGDRIWNCTKTIWKAYMEQGVSLHDSNDLWVAPEQFYYSPYTSVIREKSVKWE
ncbi:MAG: YiiX/YebB-like N1pC/P60 family cysteine hydrolase [Syntrophomonadaceae bacterium]|nr:YiiX/YebB-like N1pC/P60 family cysteine hydrolase [Syntrophomonadaceae bacterium]